MAAKPAKVTVYSTAFCAPCDGLKNYLKSNDIDFVTRDMMMEEDAAELIEDKGIRSSPVLQIDDVFYHGTDLNRDKLDVLLGLNG
ncbi:MAG: glutaredoxin family protein [Synergistales bacterium]|nr:glutaredoxin family protein [Synergistales bacterium]